MALTKNLKEIISEDKTGLLVVAPTWKRIPLREVAKVLNGFPFESRFFSSSGGTPLLRIRDVLNGDTETFYDGPFDKQFLVNPGEILVGMDGDFNCGVWSGRPALLNQRVCKITPDRRLYSGRLLRYVLPGYLAAINAATSSITVKHLSSRTIGDIELPLPPRAEQERIADKLDELLSGIDDGAGELVAARKKLAQYGQSLLKATVEGRLTGDWRDSQCGGCGETGAGLLFRVLNERRRRWESRELARFKQQDKAPRGDWQARYPEPAPPDMTNLPSLPVNWTWGSLDMLAEIQGGIQKQPSRAPVSNKFPFLRVANVARAALMLSEVNEIELFDGELRRYALQKGDVLIVEGNGSLSEIGRCAVWDGSIPDAVHQNHLIRARPILMHGHFIEAWLNSQRGIERMTRLAATTSGLYTLSVGKISRIPIPVPPLQEQKEAVSAKETLFQELARQSKSVVVGLRQVQAQRKNILRAAFSGQLVPPETADESSDAMLG